MAIYHCSCKVISRSAGRSSVGASAYRSGEKMINEYDGMEHDYSRKSGVLYSEVMLCENAPADYKNRAVLWNEVEKIEKSAKAQLAREYEIALPRELNLEEQKQLVQSFVKENFVKAGMCADFSIHDKNDGNPHAHIMVTMRPIDKAGTWGTKQKKEYILDKNGQKQYDKKKQTYKCKTVKTTDWDSKDLLEKTRESLAQKINEALEKKGLPDRVDHRSLAEQGKQQIPTIHIGVSANAMEKRNLGSDRGNVNREIQKANAEINAISIEQEKVNVTIICIRDDMIWNKVHEKTEMLENRVAENQNDKTKLQNDNISTENLRKLVEKIKPTKYTEGRTVEVAGQKIPYFDYHKNKFLKDIQFIKSKIFEYLKNIDRAEQPAPPPAQTITPTPAPAQRSTSQPVVASFDTKQITERLALHRAEFIRATVQAGERTSYQPNPIYRQQANQIQSLAQTIKEQTASIDTLRAEHGALGMFKGKEKKALQTKIYNFEKLRTQNLEKLKELGVSDVSQAPQAIKEKLYQAEQEQRRVEQAKANVGAGERAEQAKNELLNLAHTVPADQRQEVWAMLENTPQQRGNSSTMEQHQAEIKAKRLIDSVLKEDTSKGRNNTRQQTKDNNSHGGRG